MPGVVTGKPAAMRRVQATLGGCPHGLVLPMGKEGVEVMVTMEEGAMGVLLGEEPGFLEFLVGVGLGGEGGGSLRCQDGVEFLLIRVM